MSTALSFLAPLAAMSLTVSGPAESEPQAESRSWRFADVLVTSYVCELLEYEVDYERLAGWGWDTHGHIVAAGATDEAALAQIQRDIRAKRGQFNRLQGGTIIGSGRNLLFAGMEGDQALFRFKKTFGDRCEELAASSDAGAFFTRPDERLSGAGLMRKLDGMVRGSR
jgi:hypothetical protein